MADPAAELEPRHTVRQTVEELFSWLDADGDGQIDVVELQAGLQALGLGIDAEEARQLVAVLDRGGTGRFDLPTFRRFARGELPAFDTLRDPDAELRATFRVLDRDGDGYLSTEDVACAEDIDRSEAREIVAAADIDGDGRLSFREFRAAVTAPDLPDDGT